MNKSTKDILSPHSVAKVELYKRYLSVYLEILQLVKTVDKIHIYDLMCGEGVYKDGKKGSSIVALETIMGSKFTKPIKLWLNDSGKSNVEKGKTKIQRVKEYFDNVEDKPLNLKIKFTDDDFNKIIQQLHQEIKKLSNDKKMLIFLDPYGYKGITPEVVKQLLSNKNVELLLFIPTSQMYRFANKSLRGNTFEEGKSLSDILTALFDSNAHFNSVDDFIEKLRDAYFEYLIGDKKTFGVDSFTLETKEGNIYALFFFTHSLRGFEKMLEAKWKMDEKNGRGFKINQNQPSLFDNQKFTFTRYPRNLKEYIKSKDNINNLDLYIFGLNHGYLPKHTNQLLRAWQKKGTLDVCEYGTDKPARNNSFYINKNEIKVFFKIKM